MYMKVYSTVCTHGYMCMYGYMYAFICVCIGIHVYVYIDITNGNFDQSPTKQFWNDPISDRTPQTKQVQFIDALHQN